MVPHSIQCLTIIVLIEMDIGDNWGLHPHSSDKPRQNNPIPNVSNLRMLGFTDKCYTGSNWLSVQDHSICATLWKITSVTSSDTRLSDVELKLDTCIYIYT